MFTVLGLIYCHKIDQYDPLLITPFFFLTTTIDAIIYSFGVDLLNVIRN